MPVLNVTVNLKEGMKIAPINEQDKKYTLIQSSKDKSMIVTMMIVHYQCIKD